ncbi:MAG: amino acid permease [Gammaproteobacteria bacterium]|nr:amino acid permease [Gammaproteobacteria bacterium]
MEASDPVVLRRSLGLPLLTLYGLGTIIGAGIYVLIGKVAGNAGEFAPLSFLIAAGIAALTGVSYARLSKRIPLSAGEAAYANAALGRRWVTSIVGWSVVVTGIVSAAAIATGFVGYLHVYAPIPDSVAITVLVLSLGAVAMWGIAQSVTVAAIMTLIEIGGLVFVIVVGADAVTDFASTWTDLIPSWDADAWHGILLGSVLAFYAFIGFEDIVNVAEEAKQPKRDLPLAIVLSMVIAITLYLLISVVASYALSPAELAASDAPLATILERHGFDPRLSIGLISILAVTNGALIQLIMSSRVMYGMSAQGHAPKPLGTLHPRRQTPTLATALATGVILLLALGFPIETLARATSVITLFVFSVVNFSAIALDVAAGDTTNRFSLANLTSFAGMSTAILLMIWQLWALLP